MIDLRGTTTLTPNSILLMSEAITTDDTHMCIGQDSVCVCTGICEYSVCVCRSFSVGVCIHVGGYIGQMSQARTSRS